MIVNKTKSPETVAFCDLTIGVYRCSYSPKVLFVVTPIPPTDHVKKHGTKIDKIGTTSHGAFLNRMYLLHDNGSITKPRDNEEWYNATYTRLADHVDFVIPGT